MTKIALVGSPNVGKSVLFNRLTGRYTTVSNYPGTTVDIARGKANIYGKDMYIIDTPGIYSFIPITDEEKVTRNLLLQEKLDLIVHVIDAKNVNRMLNMTLQLLEIGLPIILNVNMLDEAHRAGIHINIDGLAAILDIRVTAGCAINGVGITELKHELKQNPTKNNSFSYYDDNIENAIKKIEERLTRQYGFSKRIIAILLLQGDQDMHRLVMNEQLYKEIMNIINTTASFYQYSLEYIMSLQRQQLADNIYRQVVKKTASRSNHINEWLSRLTREPITGIPLLGVVLYFGLYQFVGRFGAGYLVDFIDKVIFGQLVMPIVKYYVQQCVEPVWLQHLLLGDYGIITLGFRYAVAIILPIVGSFFLMFALLEDCGYLPRLAMLVDRVFKQFGLNGRAIIPITLGFGCGTMGVMVTRTLETKRERLLATFLLALAIPCSAQLGIVVSLLSFSSVALLIWCSYILAVFILAGWLSAKLIPGRRSNFYLELPPLRLPHFSNVIKKASTRMTWYFIEILPVFIITSVLLWFCNTIGILEDFIILMEPVMNIIGLPGSIANIFILGFLRRDYGTAGLYDMYTGGQLTSGQLLISAVTLTLFIPCVAQLAVMVKERGIITTFAMAVVITCISFVAGWSVYWLLELTKISL